MSTLQVSKAPIHSQTQSYDYVRSDQSPRELTNQIAHRVAASVATDQIRPSRTTESDSGLGPLNSRTPIGQADALSDSGEKPLFPEELAQAFQHLDPDALIAIHSSSPPFRSMSDLCCAVVAEL